MKKNDNILQMSKLRFSMWKHIENECKWQSSLQHLRLDVFNQNVWGTWR